MNNILFENCTYNTEVLKAVFRRIPFKIPAEFFGFKGEGTSSQLCIKLDEKPINNISLEDQWNEVLAADKVPIEKGPHLLKVKCNKNKIKISAITIAKDV